MKSNGYLVKHPYHKNLYKVDAHTSSIVKPCKFTELDIVFYLLKQYIQNLFTLIRDLKNLKDNQLPTLYKNLYLTLADQQILTLCIK
jgi:hypothetical protein